MRRWNCLSPNMETTRAELNFDLGLLINRNRNDQIFCPEKEVNRPGRDS